jgi:subtilisin family serine protease
MWLVLAVPAVASAQANAKENLVPRQVSVIAEGTSAMVNIGEIIAELGRQGLLNVKPHVNDDADDLATLLQHKALIQQREVPVSLELYLCRLNRHVCTIATATRELTATWRFTRAPKNVTVQGMTCDWSLPPFVLCLPELTIRDDVETSRVVPYDAKQQRLDELVTGKTGGCRVFDTVCRRTVETFNKAKGSAGDPKAPDYAGKLRVPVRGQSVTLPIFSTTHFGALTETLDTLIAAPWRIGGKSFEQANVYYTVPVPARAQSHNPPNLWPDPVTSYMDALRAMKYPFTSRADFSRIRPVVVGVWDMRVDDEHCEFVDAQGKAITVPEPLTALASAEGNAPKASPNCGESRPFGRKIFDHGTHIAGVIGARLNGHGIAGANPRAQLWTYELLYGARLDRDKDPISRVSREFPLVTTVVVNVSLDFPSTHAAKSGLASVVANFKEDVLFVAAAGNDGVPVQSLAECTVIPACWSLIPGPAAGPVGDNVVSVIALNAAANALLPSPLDPTKLGTNYGRAFDVAAVGEVVSSVHGNYVGGASGSSVATAYVTGLASLIYGKLSLNVHPTPRMVKERILFTSDLSTTFDPLVRFGRINFERALAFESDVIKLKSSACGPGIALCQPTFNIRKSDDEVVVREGKSEDGETVEGQPKIRVRDIRRIVAKSDASGSRYWLAYVKDNRLQVLRDVLFTPTSTFVYDAANDPQVNLSTILDYTACSLIKGCR